MITLRRAQLEDIPIIMQFLEDYWLHGYILAHDRDFFDWQFVKGKDVNIWIGIDDSCSKMYAMLSAIFYRETEHPDVSGSVWLAIKSDNPMLAFDVQNAMWSEMKPRATFSPGLRPDAIRINKILGNNIVAMDHYYRLNSNISHYKIAVISEKNIPVVNNTAYNLSRISNLEEFKNIIPEDFLMNSAPSKDYKYISWRYFEHPIFHYDLWKITAPNNNPCAVLISREEHANNAVSCKIVDFYGDMHILSKIAYSLDKLMQENNYEYVDIYSYGVSCEIYEQGGMLRCTENSANIIPNYFQPYTPTNSEIYLVPPTIPGTRIFRGDSDQDKPRLNASGS